MGDKNLTIYDIKRLTSETNPYFFSRETMKFFNQTLKDFSVYKLKNGNYKIVCASHFDKKFIRYTTRIFNIKTNELELIEDYKGEIELN